MMNMKVVSSPQEIAASVGAPAADVGALLALKVGGGYTLVHVYICVYVYIYIYIYTHIYACVYVDTLCVYIIYVYTERERERD